MRFKIEKITVPFIGGSASSEDTGYLGYVFGATSFSEGDYYIPASLSTVVITAQETIPTNAFFGCSPVDNVVLGNGVKTLEDYAFYHASGLKNIYFSTSVKTVGLLKTAGFTMKTA